LGPLFSICESIRSRLFETSTIARQDAFPDEDIVWGKVLFVLLMCVSLIIPAGIAYTIDKAYEAEVRDYLGEFGATLFRRLRYTSRKITEKRHATHRTRVF